MKECMVAIIIARQRAVISLDEDGIPMKGYTNQSKCINSVLIKKKESAVKNNKANNNMTKLGKSGRRYTVARQQKEEMTLAICRLSNVYELVDMAQHLRKKGT